MVVGDSISHGAVGSCMSSSRIGVVRVLNHVPLDSRRYQLWQWLRSNNVTFDFVGPWQGTFNVEELSSLPTTSLQEGEVAPPAPEYVNGTYASDIDPAFDKDHYCLWGRQAAQVKIAIAAQVATYEPDYVLVEVGFNDLAWWANDPGGLLSDTETLINNARSAKGNIKFAVANVPHRTRLKGRQDLINNTDIYNSALASAAPSWSTPSSPVRMVEFDENYTCKPLPVFVGLTSARGFRCRSCDASKQASSLLTDLFRRTRCLCSRLGWVAPKSTR